MNVLITVPRLERTGGVANYYVVLRRHLDADIRYFEIGAPSRHENRAASIWRIVSDFWCFHRELRSRNYGLVHVNPSLGVKAVVRDRISGVSLSLEDRFSAVDQID